MHTPTPWKVGDHPRDNSGTDWREILFESPFGDAYLGQALKEDAAFIVQAVNEREALVALARHVLAMDGDAYLVGHPEFIAIVEEAKTAVTGIITDADGNLLEHY